MIPGGSSLPPIENTEHHSLAGPAPFLPKEIEDGKQYTLVLDLDETLVHYYEV
jgi:hypothetical protein